MSQSNVTIFGITGAPQVSWPPDPIQNPLAWDKIEVAGVKNPGLAIVGEVKRKHVWDEKKGKGQPRATLTFTGAYLARVSIDFILLAGPDFKGGQYTDLEDWLTFSQQFQYDPTKMQPTAVDVYHPSLMMIGLKSFICEEIGAPFREVIGHYRARVSLIEFAPTPPVNVTATVVKSKPTPPVSARPPGVNTDPADVALQKAIGVELGKAQAPP